MDKAYDFFLKINEMYKLVNSQNREFARFPKLLAHKKFLDTPIAEIELLENHLAKICSKIIDSNESAGELDQFEGKIKSQIERIKDFQIDMSSCLSVLKELLITGKFRSNLWSDLEKTKLLKSDDLRSGDFVIGKFTMDLHSEKSSLTLSR